MSRSIKSLKKLKSMVGKEVKVCTLDNVIGLCLVTEDNAGDTCLISKDKALLETRYFWEIQGEREYIKNCTTEYVAGHYCWRKHQLIEELKWVTSSIPCKKPTKKTKVKPTVTVKEKPAKETENEIVLEPKSVEELWAKAPCKVRLLDGQIGYAEKEDGRERHAVVYFNEGLNGGIGWKAEHPMYKHGWYVNCTYDFEKIFGKKEEKPVVATKETRDDAFKPLNIEHLEENIPCNVLLKDGQIGYVDYERGVPTVYFDTPVNKVYGWSTDAEGFNVGWHINDEEDFEAVFETSEGKLAQSAEPVEPSLQEVLKDILETLKEIKNEIVKR